MIPNVKIIHPISLNKSVFFESARNSLSGPSQLHSLKALAFRVSKNEEADPKVTNMYK
jgi:hypothetical protein